MSFATRSVTHTIIPCNEHELVAAVRRGDDRAFERLYSGYRSRISSYVFGLVGDHGRAEDIAQEVFLAALRRLRDTERPIAFKPWIYEIAKNACIDEFRRTRRSREVPLQPEDGSECRLASWRPSPDAAVADKQSLDDLKGAFHGLSERHHQVLVMRELEGLSYRQIGERLGMSRPMVESTLFRARKKLGEEYDELVSGRRCDHVQTLIASEHKRSLLKLGVRERRQLARHLAHCQPCRHQARLAGVEEEALFKAPRTLAGKIAALLPFPWLRLRRSHGGGNEDAAVTSGQHSWNVVRGLQTVANLGDPTGPAAGFGRAAAAAAAIAVAGVGGGVVAGSHGSSGTVHRDAPAAVSAVKAAHTTKAHRLTTPKGGGSVSTRHARSAADPKGVAKTGGAAAKGRASNNAGGSSGSQQSSSATSGAREPQVASVSSAPGQVTNGQGATTTPQLPSLPSVNLPTPQLPSLPKLQLPQLQLPRVQLPPPSVQLPHVSVPGAPDATKLLRRITHGG